MDLHILVVCLLDCVRSRHDIAQHVVATDRAIVFRVNESVSQQAPKQGGITVGQSNSPVVLEPKQYLRYGILRARSLRSEQ